MNQKTISNISQFNPFHQVNHAESTHRPVVSFIETLKELRDSIMNQQQLTQKISEQILSKLLQLLSIKLNVVSFSQQFSQQFWKLFSKLEFIQIKIAKCIFWGNDDSSRKIKGNDHENEDYFYCFLIDGTVDIENTNNFDKKDRSSRSRANSSFGKRSPRKKCNRIAYNSLIFEQDPINPNISQKIYLDPCINTIQTNTAQAIAIINSNSPPIIILTKENYLLPISNGRIIKVLKKSYEYFKTWLYHYQQQYIIDFLSKSMMMSIDEIKLYKIHKKYILKNYKIGQIINLKNEQNLLILMKGQLKLRYNYKNQQINSQQKNNNYCLQLFQKSMINTIIKIQNLYYQQINIQKDSIILIFNKIDLQQLFQWYPKLQDKFKKMYKNIQHPRIKYFPIFSINQLPQQIIKYQFQQFNNKQIKLKSSKKRFSKKLKKYPILDQNYQQFISIYPYNKIIQSIQKVHQKKMIINSNKCNQKCQKILYYIKQSQLKQKQHNAKLIKLKMKTIAQKTIPNQARKSVSKSGQRCSTAQISDKLKIHKGLFDQDQQIIRKQNNNPKKLSRQQSMNLVSTMEQRQSQKHRSTLQSQFCSDLDIVNQNKDEMFLSSNDTGIIHQFVKGSHRYRKQLAYLLRCSQLSKKVTNKQKIKNSNFMNKQNLSMFTHQTLQKFIRKQQNKFQSIQQEEDNYNNIFYNRCITQNGHGQSYFDTVYKNPKRQKKILKKAQSGRLIRVKIQ